MAPFTSSHEDEVWGLDYFSLDEIDDDQPNADEGAGVNIGASNAPDLQESLPTHNIMKSRKDHPHCESVTSKSSD